MIYEEFQIAYERIHTYCVSLLQICEEKERIYRHMKYDCQQLNDSISSIKTIINNLQKQKYMISAVSVQRVGKSTFLNAIMGLDILARDTKSCTFCATEIRHTEQENLLLEYRAGQSDVFTVCRGNTEDIRKSFLSRTREIRSNNNSDKVIHYEIKCSIETIKKLSPFIDVVFVDTPGSNEWESNTFDISVSRQATSKAIKESDIIFFVLDYHNYANDNVESLIAELIRNRPDILNINSSNVYFILNKIDVAEIDSQEISFFVKDIKDFLVNKFGFLDPKIYPVSSKQALLSKLIQKKVATINQKQEFQHFFGAKYAIKNDSGKLEIPLPEDISSIALKDSGIPKIENLIESIVNDSNRKLLQKNLYLITHDIEIIYNVLLTRYLLEKGNTNINLQNITTKNNFLLLDWQNRRDFVRNKQEFLTAFICDKQEEWVNLIFNFFEFIKENATTKIEEHINKNISGSYVTSNRSQYSYNTTNAGHRTFDYKGTSDSELSIEMFSKNLLTSYADIKNEVHHKEKILIENIKFQIWNNILEVSEYLPDEIYSFLSPTQLLDIQFERVPVIRDVKEVFHDYSSEQVTHYETSYYVRINKTETINAIKQKFSPEKSSVVDEVQQKVLPLIKFVEKYMNDIENQLILEQIKEYRCELENVKNSLS